LIERGRVNNGCACRKLDPAVLMMKAAEDRLSSELAEPSNRPMARRILIPPIYVKPFVRR
jgi:hypothetical protein